MGRVKKALEKYTSVSTERYVILKIEDRNEIVLELGQERFPHLAGMQYIDKYKHIPSMQVVEKIKNDVISDDFVNRMSKQNKKMINNKTKAIISDMDFVNSKFIFSHKDSEIILGRVRGNLLILSNNKSNTKKYAFMFKKGPDNVFYPNSCLLLKNNENLLRDIAEYKHYKAIELIHSKRIKILI